MSFFSLVGLVGVAHKKDDVDKSPEELRKEYGFNDFDIYMQDLKNHDPAVDLERGEQQSASTEEGKGAKPVAGQGEK